MSRARSREAVLANLEHIRSRIGRACTRSDRDPATVRLVAATKTVEPVAIGWVRDAGVTEVGENYVKELRAKRASLNGLVWHFLGTLQSHTAHVVAEHADVVQTLVPGSGFARLARRATERGVSMPALIEVDFTSRRSGLAPEDVERFADEVAVADGVDLVGLMTIPPPTATSEGARPWFARLREIRDLVASAHPGATGLSMGMSLDYEVAVEEGATMVRIGTALFGARPSLA
jgi:pyridoxal phosphate enzyme (YggS family)